MVFSDKQFIKKSLESCYRIPGKQLKTYKDWLPLKKSTHYHKHEWQDKTQTIQ